ncbi:MAG: ABC transporter ATP-binding protein [Leptolinea sp.]|jgi:iron complex transport system ATP-binding protein|nr:ABC transporter ATP-binding protein [Leptolinea sp.]
MILNVKNLKFHYPNHSVINSASFSVGKGEMLAVLGTNGTGKTTLLKTINRLLKPQAGVVLLDNIPVTSLNRNTLAQRIGYVEQQRTGSRTTVFNAVLLGRKPYIRWDITKKDIEIAEEAMATLGLIEYALRYLDELSGGELQKVVIARALAQQPEVLLLDEPTSSLDLKNQLDVLSLIRRITRERGIAAVVAIHDLNMAIRFADQFILLKNKEVYAAGGIEVITPENIEAVYSVPVTLTKYNGYQVVIPL